jgi:hypothetical protein
MKKAATLYHATTNHLKEAYEKHHAFAGREPRFRMTVLLFLFCAISIISYSSTFFFS